MGVTMTMDEVGILVRSVYGLTKHTENYHPNTEDTDKLKKVYVVDEKNETKTWYEIKPKSLQRLEPRNHLPGYVFIKSRRIVFGPGYENKEVRRWDKFIEEEIIPELENQGVTVVRDNNDTT